MKSNESMHPQKRRLLLAIRVLGVLLIVAAAVFLLRSRGNNWGAPRIMVDQQSIDYGYIRFGERRSFKIIVTNEGDGILRFQEKPYIEVLEGC